MAAASPLAKVEDMAKIAEAAREELETALNARNAAIRAALEAGCGQVHVAAAASMSQSTIARIDKERLSGASK